MLNRRWALGFSLILTLGLVLGIACSTGPTGGGGGGGAPDETDGDGNDNSGDTGTANENTADDSGGGDQTPAGAAAMQTNGCTACHTTEMNNFTESTVDDIVDTLLGDIPHPGGDFDDLSEQDIDDITDFLVAVIVGDEEFDVGDGGADGNDNDDGDDGPTETQAHAWFEQVWTDFDENYSHFAVKSVDWDAAYDQYEPQFQDEMTAATFATNIAEMLAELRDLHVSLFDPDGQAVEVYSKVAQQNFPNGFPDQYYPNGVEQWGDYPLEHGLMNNNIAYFSIDSFDADRWDGLTTGQVDDLFAMYADADGLVVDVRANNGGSEIVAGSFAAHLTDSSYVYGYHRTKQPGPDHDDFGDFVEHRVDPAEGNLFLRPVACLIGETNLSSAEWFVLMMLENPRFITLIGDTTRGSSGSPQEFSLDNGVIYNIPSWEAFRADQTTPIEDVGIDPTPGYSVPPEDSFTDDSDFVLEQAIDLLTS